MSPGADDRRPDALILVSAGRQSSETFGSPTLAMHGDASYNPRMATDVAAPVTFLGLVPSSATALATLSSPVRSWFTERFGQPTVAQRLAWPTIAAGEDLLLAAPTGSGKTLAAHLPIVSRIGDEPGGSSIRCVHVVP